MTSPATSTVDSAQVRALVVEAVEASAELMESSPVADQWDEASALEGMTVGALGDRFLTLDDFCRTRMIEVLVHLDDLAVSTSQRRPVTDPTGIAIVIDISVGIARHAHGDWNVLYALARTERSAIEPVFPAF